MFQDKEALFHFINFIEKLEKIPGPHQAHLVLFQDLKNEKTMGQAYKKIFALANNIELLPLKYLFLSWAHLEKKSFKKCLEEAQNVINSIKNHDLDYNKLLLSTAHILGAMALLYINEKELPKEFFEAISAELTSAVNCDPKNEVAYIARADLYLRCKEKKFDAAKQDCERAIQLNSNYELAYILISYIYASPEYANYDPQKTIKYVLDRLKKNPSVFSDCYYIQLNNAYEKMGQFDECCNAATKALDDMQPNSWVHRSHSHQNYVPILKNFDRLGKAVTELENYHSILQTPSKKQESTKIKAITPAQKQLLQNKLDALTRINNNLKPALNELLKNPSEENKNAVIKILHSENATLGKDRGYSKIAKNIALAVALIGVGYVAAGLINLAITRGKHFAFFTPKSMQKVEAIERHAVDYYKKKKRE